MIVKKRKILFRISCIALLIVLTSLGTYFASYYSNKRNHERQLKEKRKSLAITLSNDINSLFEMYVRVARTQILSVVPDNHVPVIKLVEPRQNYFSVFDNKIKELEIIDDPIQQKIILFYGRAKALYDELLEYSRKIDNFIRFKNDLGFMFFRMPGEQLEQMTDDDISRITNSSSEAIKHINSYSAKANTLFNDLRGLYLFLAKEDTEINSLYEEIKEGLAKYVNSL